MNRKNLPLILMLTAGVITCIITFIQKFSLLWKLLSLLIVLLIFYLLGSVLKWTLDYFDRQNEIRRKEEGEVIEKDAEDGADVQETAGHEEAHEQEDQE